MFKRLIKRLYFKAYPWAADIGKDEVRELSVEVQDLRDNILIYEREVKELRDNIRAYERQEISRTTLSKRAYEAIEFIPSEMISTVSAQENFEKYLRDNFARKLEPEIAKRFVIKQDKDLSNPTMTAYRGYITFYEEV